MLGVKLGWYGRDGWKELEKEFLGVYFSKKY